VTTSRGEQGGALGGELDMGFEKKYPLQEPRQQPTHYSGPSKNVELLSNEGK